jgi:hypothetical protein
MAVEGGVPTFLLGIVLHFVIATCIATVYYRTTLVLPVLIRHPVVSGNYWTRLPRRIADCAVGTKIYKGEWERFSKVG